MFTAAAKALSDMFSPPLRAVLLKSVGLGLLVIVLIGIAFQRLFAWLATYGANWAETTTGVFSHSVWTTLAWVLSIMASLGIITGALFLMPAVTAFVGSFFVDEIAEHVERADYPADPVGIALPVTLALLEGIKIALLALFVYLLCLPFVFFAGVGFLLLFLANAYLLSREYFELAAMRFRPPHEAKAMRKANGTYLFFSGFFIAALVSIPVINLATPIFAMAMMVHVHKTLSGPRPELIEPKRA
jgi:CysZ protein